MQLVDRELGPAAATPHPAAAPPAGNTAALLPWHPLTFPQEQEQAATHAE